MKTKWDDWWKSFDMDKTGLFFEDCCDIIYKYYNIYINIEGFIDYYLTSDMRYLIDIHHPNLSTRSNEENIIDLIKNDFDNEIPEYLISDCNQKINFFKNELYWMGWFFIYCLYENKNIETSKELHKVLNFSKLRNLYSTFHEMDLKNCYNRIFNN